MQLMKTRMIFADTLASAKSGMTKGVAVMGLTALGLSGCAAGSANLYAQPVAEFAQAVEQTSMAVSTYASLQQHLTVADTIARTAQSNKAVGFTAADCDPSKVSVKCRLTDFKSGAALLPAVATAVSPQVAMMQKMQIYARLLVSIARAESAEDLQVRQRQAETAYDDLFQGVKDAKSGNLTDVKVDLKAAIEHGLGSLYLNNKRIELLAALVDAGDPVVAELCDMLAKLSVDTERQFMISQRSRVSQLVDDFDVLGTAYRKNMGGLQIAEFQSLRRAVLADAAREAGMLQAVLNVNAKTAFARMQIAHLELRRALILADSNLGKAIVAIQNFSAAAYDANRAYQAILGLM